MVRPSFEVADVLRAYGDAYAAHLSLGQTGFINWSRLRPPNEKTFMW
jgi:hypothetical protein